MYATNGRYKTDLIHEQHTGVEAEKISKHNHKVKTNIYFVHSDQVKTDEHAK